MESRKCSAVLRVKLSYHHLRLWQLRQYLKPAARIMQLCLWASGLLHFCCWVSTIKWSSSTDRTRNPNKTHRGHQRSKQRQQLFNLRFPIIGTVRCGPSVTGGPLLLSGGLRPAPSGVAADVLNHDQFVHLLDAFAVSLLRPRREKAIFLTNWEISDNSRSVKLSPGAGANTLPRVVSG
jgi:hypothetical protein